MSLLRNSLRNIYVPFVDVTEARQVGDWPRTGDPLRFSYALDHPLAAECEVHTTALVREHILHWPSLAEVQNGRFHHLLLVAERRSRSDQLEIHREGAERPSRRSRRRINAGCSDR